MTVFALPFLTIDTTVVAAGRWELAGDDGQSEQLDKGIAHWDYARNLALSRRLEVKFDRCAEKLGIAARDLKLIAFARAGTGEGNLPRVFVATAAAALLEGSAVAEFRFDIPGSSLSRRVWLETLILLADPSPGNALSPQLVGSKLWRDVHDVRIENAEQRFPVEAMSFKRHFAGRAEEGALWFLHWHPSDMAREFSGGVRLFLNADRPEFVNRVVDSDPFTIQAVMADVMCQMISAAIAQEGIDDVIAAYEPETIGAQIARWIERAFPGRPVAAVRQLLRDEPGLFRAALQTQSDLQGYEP